MKSKIIITIILFLFSILYINNAVYLIREKDKLMIEIKEKEKDYYVSPISAIITEHVMIPGAKGKKVNIKKSYNNMKGIDTFKESLLIYDEIMPSKTIYNIYDKVIISGNLNKNKISILTNLDNTYCYTENLDIKRACIEEKKVTIKVYKITNNYLSNVKKILRNGIVFFLDNINQDELNIIVKYIKNNNYQIVDISELISD